MFLLVEYTESLEEICATKVLSVSFLVLFESLRSELHWLRSKLRRTLLRTKPQSQSRGGEILANWQRELQIQLVRFKLTVHWQWNCRKTLRTECANWSLLLGKDLTPYRIGEHSNPQAKNASNNKNRMFSILGVFLTYCASGAVLLCLGGQDLPQ